MHSKSQFTPPHFVSMEFTTLLAMYLSVATMLYTAYWAIYRLYFSPIARFPGRKLAALTFWYEFYFDVIKRGSYVWEIKRMHETYGIIQFQCTGPCTDFDVVPRPDHSH